MSDAALALSEPLVKATCDYNPSVVAPGTVLLDKIGLFVTVHVAQAGEAGGRGLVVALFDASTQRGRPGMSVTCVGLSSDVPKAAADAVAHWCLGVLPVLVYWRGDHSCLVSTTTFEVPASSGPVAFDVLKGPIIERGEHNGGADAAPPSDGYLTLLAERLRGARLKHKRHWLECFAIRTVDGSIDATCRLDNRDWTPGKQALAADAGGWPGATESFHSRRQFLLLVPQGNGEEEAEPRSLWSRLFGRA